MKIEAFNDIKNNFDKNQDSVKQLMTFDRILLDYCIGAIKTLDNTIRDNPEIRITNVRFLPTSTITALETVRQNDSMRTQYEHIFNQCLVLSVSYFISTLHSIFKQAINHACCCCPDLLTASDEDIKISFNELKSYSFNLTDSLGDLIIKKKDISFQDMQSVHKAFKSFLNVNIQRDKTVNNIIFATASRHAIVHALSIADEKFIKQIRDCDTRDIKPSINENDPIQFNPDEIEVIQKSMDSYITNLIMLIEEKVFYQTDQIVHNQVTKE